MLVSLPFGDSHAVSLRQVQVDGTEVPPLRPRTVITMFPTKPVPQSP